MNLPKKTKNLTNPVKKSSKRIDEVAKGIKYFEKKW